MISMKSLINENKNYCEEYFVENYYDVKEFVEFMESYKPDINEAEYQGRKVKLGKPTRGDVKKFKVYVKNPQGNVVKVNFGHKGKGGEKGSEERHQTAETKHGETLNHLTAAICRHRVPK